MHAQNTQKFRYTLLYNCDKLYMGLSESLIQAGGVGARLIHFNNTLPNDINRNAGQNSNIQIGRTMNIELKKTSLYCNFHYEILSLFVPTYGEIQIKYILYNIC